MVPGLGARRWDGRAEHTRVSAARPRRGVNARVRGSRVVGAPQRGRVSRLTGRGGMLEGVLHAFGRGHGRGCRWVGQPRPRDLGNNSKWG